MRIIIDDLVDDPIRQQQIRDKGKCITCFTAGISSEQVKKAFAKCGRSRYVNGKWIKKR